MQLNAKRARQASQRSLVAFVVGAVRYALEIGIVREIVTPLPLTMLPHTPEGLAGVADHRAEVLPIIDLRVRFGLDPSLERNKKTKWILVMVGGHTVGLVVDDVLGVLRVAESDLRPSPELGGGERVRGISFVTMHERALVFVLDVTVFEKLAEQFDHRSLLAPGPPRDPGGA
ncbi:MAG TPA: chemotaxis protein CheW [Polyangiaceae bacterium]|jgi:purine-binding chemotaxis protein CheW